MLRNFFSGMVHKFKLYVNEFGGRGHCVWSEKVLSFREEMDLREEFKKVVVRLAAEFGVEPERIVHVTSGRTLGYLRSGSSKSVVRSAPTVARVVSRGR